VRIFILATKPTVMGHVRFINFRNLLFAVAGVLLIISCSEEPLFDKQNEVITETQSAADTTLIEGHYIVVISQNPASKDSRAAEILEQVTGELSKQQGAKINKTYKNALSGFAAELTEKQVKELREDDRVLIVEHDRQVYLHNEPVVQEVSSWGLDRVDQRQEGLDRAYVYTASGKGVTAYVIDTGMRISHDEFGGRAVLGPDFVQEDGDEGADCYDHGTPVAGIIGGTTYGVAKDINLVSIKVFTCAGSSPESRILEALDWVQLNASPPAVVNASFGYYASEAMDLAFENVLDSGIHFAASAGNTDEDACNYSPARIPGVITAGASDIEDKIANYSYNRGSNYGDCVDIFAPGHQTTTASANDDTSSRYFSGTSAAAPYVSGVIALYLEVFPDATPTEVQAALKENATPNAISGVPSGTTDLLHSLWEPVDFTPPSPPDLNLKAYGHRNQGSNYLTLYWDPTDAEHINVYIDGVTHKVYIAGEPSPFPHENDGYTQIRLENNKKNVTHIIKICEVGYNNCSEEIEVVYGNGGDSGGEITNELPNADFTYTADLLRVQFTDTSTDADGTVVAWNWNFGDSQTSTAQNPSHNFATEGTYNVTLTVTDDAGDTGSTSQNITVSAEEPVPGDINLTGTGKKVKGRWTADLFWTPAGTSASVDIYRNGSFYETVNNSGAFTDATDFNGSGSLTYKVCEAGSENCSNELTLSF
jgi:subtilisin family serine protease